MNSIKKAIVASLVIGLSACSSTQNTRQPAEQVAGPSTQVEQAGASQPDVQTLKIDTEYGSLAFNGEIERTLTDRYAIISLTNVNIRLLPDAEFNQVKSANLNRIRLLARVKLENGKYLDTFEETKPVEINLDAKQLQGTISDIEFVMPIRSYRAASFVSLVVIDYHDDKGMMWPMRVKLKRQLTDNAT